VLQILLAKPLDDYQTTRAIKPASLSKQFEDSLKVLTEEPHVAEGEDDRPKTNKEKTAYRTHLMHKVHTDMDRTFAENEEAINWDIQHWNTKAAWRRIAKCIEHAFIDALEVDEQTARKLKGHGKPKYATAAPDPIDDVAVKQQTSEGAKARRATQQSRRCQQIADRIKRNHRQPTAKDMLIEPARKAKILAENASINELTCAKLITNIRSDAAHEEHLAGKLHPFMPYDMTTYSTFRWHQKRYEDDARKFSNHEMATKGTGKG